MNARPDAPVLVACSHGTRSAAGNTTVEELRTRLRQARPGLEVVAAHVDVQEPELGAVVDGLREQGRTCVVVPLLLSSGYHVRVDIARAVDAADGAATSAAAMGPDDVITTVLLQRLAEAGGRFADAVVLAAAGSSDAQARADVDRAVASLAGRFPGPVTSGFLSAQEPTVADAVAAARAAGASTVAVASYLLAPGVFSQRLVDAGADVVADPLGPHPLLVELVLHRFDTALAALTTSGR